MDGTPWVRDNGDINLIKVTPEPGTFNVNRADAQGQPYASNETVINPDMGNIPTEYVGGDVSFPDGNRFAWPTVSDFVRTSTYDPNQSNLDVTRTFLDNNGNDKTVAQYMFPLDGRSGLTTQKAGPEGLTGGGTYAEFYDHPYAQTQIWDRSSTLLSAHDLVLSAISHIDNQDEATPPGQNNDIEGKTDWAGYKRESMYDMLGCMVVVPDDGVNYSTRFRPPVNWDPTDRANAPYFTENPSLESHTFSSYPATDIEGNSVTWDIAIEDYFKPERRSANNDNAGPLRLGSVRVTPGGSQWDDSVQGWSRSMDVTWNEYGADEAQDVEAMTMLAFDGTYGDNNGADPAKRNLVRRALIQRGIDIYGAFRSQGKFNFANGAHTEPYDWYLLWALLGTSSGTLRDDIVSVMDGNLGKASNGTLKNANDLLPNGLSGIGSNRGQIYKMDQNNVINPGRICDLNIVATGTVEDIVDGSPVQTRWIEVEPPEANIAGEAAPGIQNRRMYHVSGLDTRVNNTDSPLSESAAKNSGEGPTQRGRWGIRNNQSEVNGETFVSYYVRCVDDSGTERITRIIQSHGSTYKDVNNDGNLVLIADRGIYGGINYDGNWFTNTTQRFYLQEDIFDTVADPTTKTIDMSSTVQEDFAEGRDIFRSINDAASLQSLAGAVQYSWAGLRGQIILPFFEALFAAEGRTIPDYWDNSMTYVKRLWTDPIMTGITQDEGLPVGTSYMTYLASYPATASGTLGQYAELWKALIKKYNVDPQGETVAADPTGRAAKIKHWPAVDQQVTWIPVEKDFVTGVTAVFGTPWDVLMKTSAVEVSTYDGYNVVGGNGDSDTSAGEPSNSTINRVQRQKVTVNGQVRDAVRIQSSTGRSLDYSTYVAGKQFYIWQSGATRPMILEKIEDTYNASNNNAEKAWVQTWVFPADTPTWPDTDPEYILNHVYNWFYADPQ